MTGRILFSIGAGVAEVRFNRPKKVNAIDPAIFGALVTIGKRLVSEAGLRAVVLSGEGYAFCVGLDMGSTASPDSNDAGLGISAGRLARCTHRATNLPQYACTVWRNLPVPVLIAIYGVAYGGGPQITLGVDVCYVAADTRLSVMKIKWGLVPGMGGMVLTCGLVHPDRLRELVYSDCVVNGEEASALRLTTHAVDDSRATALMAARNIALKNPNATRAGKRSMQVAGDGDIAAILLVELVEQDRLIGADNQHEVVLAGMQSRAPIFQSAVKSEQRLEIAWGWQPRRWRA